MTTPSPQQSLFHYVFYLRRDGRQASAPNPLFEDASVTVHRTGTFGAGTSELRTPLAIEPFFQPARRRSMRLVATGSMAVSPEHAFSLVLGQPVSSSPTPNPGIQYIELETPYPAVYLRVQDVPLACLGVYTEDYDALVVTDVANYRHLIHTGAPSQQRKPFVYTMDLGMTFTVALNVQRVCSRWARWTREQPSRGSAHRFIQFEHYLRSYNDTCEPGEPT